MASGGKYFLYIHYMDPHEPYRKTRSVVTRGVRIQTWIALQRTTARSTTWNANIAELYRLFQVGCEHGGSSSPRTTGRNFFDHGALGQRERTLFDEVLHVPLIVVAAGRFQGDPALSAVR
jgi:hypothetical protein